MTNEQRYREALDKIRDYCDNAIATAMWDSGDGSNVQDIFNMAYEATIDSPDEPSEQVSMDEFLRYKKALQTANGFLIMNNLEPVKLEYAEKSSESEERSKLENRVAILEAQIRNLMEQVATLQNERFSQRTTAEGR